MRTEVFCAFLAVLVCCEATNYGLGALGYGAAGLGGLGYGAAGLGGLGYGAAGYTLPVAERVVAPAATVPAAASATLPLRSSPYGVGAYTIVLDNGATYVVAADPTYSGALRYGYGSPSDVAAKYVYYLKK